MGYIVTRGEVHHDHVIYRVGEELPCQQGSLADVEAAGAVVWNEDAPVLTPAPLPRKKGGKR